MTSASIYDRDLGRQPANYAPLTPLSLIARTAYTWPQRLAVVHGERRYTWGETYARARRLASALTQAGIGKNDTVAVMLANTPEMIEAVMVESQEAHRAAHAEALVDRWTRPLLLTAAGLLTGWLLVRLYRRRPPANASAE